MYQLLQSPKRPRTCTSQVGEVARIGIYLGPARQGQAPNSHLIGSFHSDGRKGLKLRYTKDVNEEE